MRGNLSSLLSLQVRIVTLKYDLRFTYDVVTYIHIFFISI